MTPVAELKLRASNGELRNRFPALQTPRDVAALLEIEYSHLVYLLYRRKPQANYTTFFLKKKSGGQREISAPIWTLKIIQRKLNHILQLVYKPKASVHGFAIGKSITTNAREHAKRQCVLNVDLADFFPSINFGRVRGMFMAIPYNIGEKAATVLAQICCYNGALPRGAPTSPVVSNMICGKLDSQLLHLARQYRCTFTRYADDITFSTTAQTFPDALARVNFSGESRTIEVGRALEKVIIGNGFSINQHKVRLHLPTGRQVVTGLTVNRFPNVRRRLIQQVRAMLHAWKEHGLECAEEEHLGKYSWKQRKPNGPPPSFRRIVQGKINFIRMVRGEKDVIYRKLASEFHGLVGEPFPKVYRHPREEIFDALWILESVDPIGQGTAFALDTVGLVTCHHVLRSGTYAFRHDAPGKQHPVSIAAENRDLDIAIIKIEELDLPSLRVGDDTVITYGDRLTVAGFPNYNLGDFPNVREAQVTGFRTVHSIKRPLLSGRIVCGTSGGPVLNKDNEVIGIAATGADREEDEGKTEYHSVIPISTLKYLPWKHA